MLAAHKIVVGCYVVEKASRAESPNIYKVVTVGVKVALSEHIVFSRMFKDAPSVKDIKIPIMDVIKDFSVIDKAKIPIAVENRFVVAPRKSLLLDLKRCCMYKALMDFEAAQEAEAPRALAYGVRPYIVVAAKDIAKGALKLAPLTDMRK